MLATPQTHQTCQLDVHNHATEDHCHCQQQQKCLAEVPAALLVLLLCLGCYRLCIGSAVYQ